MPRPYQATGFRLDGPLENGDIVYITAAAVTIAKGDALHDNGSGLVTNATTAFAATFMGIAAEACASGAVCPVIRPNSKHLWWVPCASVLAATTDIGEIVDLGGSSCNKVDVSDNTLVAWGFRVEEIDVSAAAVAANTQGYVKGAFWPQPQ
jgi:hypothetical protein